MPKYSFNNEYDIVIWTFSYLLHRFEDSGNLFAAQCIWWIASLIKLTNVVAYYHLHKIFPSEHHNQPKESSVSNTRDSRTTKQNWDISPLDLNEAKESVDRDIESVLSDHELEQCSKSDSDNIDTRTQAVVSETHQYLSESRRLRELHLLQHRSNPIRTRKQHTSSSASSGGQKLKDRQNHINSLERSKKYSNIEF
jgi:hypothetical protein